MLYMVYKDGDVRKVAIGDNYPLNVHVVGESGLEQTAEWITHRVGEIEDRGRAAMSSLVERFGKVTPLTGDALEASNAALEKVNEEMRQAARERLSAPIDFVRIPQEVLDVDKMTRAQLFAQLPAIRERQDKLEGDRRIRYYNFLYLGLTSHGPEPTFRHFVSDSLMAFASLEHAERRLAEEAAKTALGERSKGFATTLRANARRLMPSTMLARKLDERKARTLREGRQEGLRDGLRDGRLAERAEWDAWLERMAAAQAAGESFDEPPPSRRSGDMNGTAGRGADDEDLPA